MATSNPPDISIHDGDISDFAADPDKIKVSQTQKFVVSDGKRYVVKVFSRPDMKKVAEIPVSPNMPGSLVAASLPKSEKNTYPYFVYDPNSQRSAQHTIIISNDLGAGKRKHKKVPRKPPKGKPKGKKNKRKKNKGKKK